MSDAPVTIASYYRVHWGHVDEFLDLFRRNHWPVLADQLASGRFSDVRAYRPRFHGDGAADWHCFGAGMTPSAGKATARGSTL